MNPDVLKGITQSVAKAIDQYGSRFRGIINHPTTGQNVKQSNIELAGRVLEFLENFLNPEILVVPKREIEALPLENGGSFGGIAVEKALKCISASGCFMRRATAESDPAYVQIVPCGLLTYENRVFLFQRKESDPKSRLYGRTTIWQGCHVPRQGVLDMPDLLKTTLLNRISGSLFLSRVFPIEPLGYCWDRDNENSNRHFGVGYRIDINNPFTAMDLRKKEFRKRRGYGLIGQFAERQALAAKQDELNLESWSRAILRGVKEESWTG